MILNLYLTKLKIGKRKKKSMRVISYAGYAEGKR